MTKKACALKAHVRNSEGKIVESRLYNDLLHYTNNNRPLTNEFYAVGTAEEFLRLVRDREDFKTDENGEITFASLRAISKMDIEAETLLQILNKDIGSGEYEYEEALRRVQNFNEHSPMADKTLATMQALPNGKYQVSVTMNVTETTDSEGHKTKESNASNAQKALHDTVRNKEMEKKIISLLRSHHVSVEFLQNDEQGGRYSTENISRAEDGLYGLIQINETGNVTDVLAEETGHFVVGAMGNHQLVKRFEEMLKDPRVQQEAVGKEAYEEAALGKNPAREVAGRLVGKALQRKLDNNAPFKVLANRIANIAKQVFAKITGNEMRWAQAKAEQIANKIAYQFIEGNDNFSVENAIDIEETMRNGTYTMNQRLFRDTVDELGRLCKRLEAISNDTFSKQAEVTQALAAFAGIDENSGESALQMAGPAAEQFAFDGIVTAIVGVSNYLGQGMRVDTLLNEVDLKNPAKFYANMSKNGEKLRQVRTFLFSAEAIINTIREATEDGAHNKLSVVNGTSLRDVRYRDQDGVWHSIDLLDVLKKCQTLITDYKRKLGVKEATYFAQFCTDIYGQKYISGVAGTLWSDIFNRKESGEESMHKFDDVIAGEDIDDIDLFHRYLGSMSNNPDFIGEVVDKVMKAANKNADDATERDVDQVLILQDRAEKLGLDLADLMERDNNGVPTGNLITPPAQPSESNLEETAIYNKYMEDLGYVPAINYSRWENEREQLKKSCMEAFKQNHPDWESWTPLYRGLKWDEYFGKEIKRWNKANSLKVSVTDPKTNKTLYTKWVPNGLYASDSWSKLEMKYPSKGNDSLLRWVSDYMAIKQRLDGLLPVGATVSYRLPQIKGNICDTARNTMQQQTGAFKRTKAYAKGLWRRTWLNVIATNKGGVEHGDETTMKSYDEGLLGTPLNFENERAYKLVTFGINKLEDMRDLSTDILGSLIAYSSMAHSYACTDAVVDALEVGRNTLWNRELKGKITKLEKVKFGFKKPKNATETLFSGQKNRAFSRYVKFLDKQVYGISSEFADSSSNMFIRMLSNMHSCLAGLAGFSYLQGNILGGWVNTNTGFLNIWKEAAAGYTFSPKDLMWAHWYYFKHFVPMWLETGKLHRDNKLGLFLEAVNFQGDKKNKYRNWRTKRSRVNNFIRMAGYLPYSSGDHYMQAMSYLAVANHTNLYNTDGTKASNLWNAYIQEANTDDLGDFKKGKTLEFNRLNPMSSREITSEALTNRGVYLKMPRISDQNELEYAIMQDQRFADDVYRRDHNAEFRQMKKDFKAMSEQEMMQHISKKYNVAASILEKTETYLKSNSPLAQVPVFTQEELDYLSMKKLSTGEYDNILAVIKQDIFEMIWSKDAESAYMDRCRETNNRLHGIYNQQDKTAWHQNWYTNAVLGMKGWALGNLEYMWSNNHYSVAYDDYVEGFFNTAFKVGVDGLWKKSDTREGLTALQALFVMAFPWKGRARRYLLKAGYSRVQHENMKRFAAHTYLQLLLALIGHLTAPPPKDSDEENPWALNLIHYLVTRASLEQYALSIIYDLKQSQYEFQQLADLMPVGYAAGLQWINLAYLGVGALVADKDNKDFFYQQDDPKEKYKEGDSKFYVQFRNVVPYWKSMWGLSHPEYAEQAYLFGRKMK